MNAQVLYPEDRNPQLDILIDDIQQMNSTLRRLVIATEIANDIKKDERGRYYKP